jgi:aminopeptidase
MPNDNILKKYAELLVNFALWSGKGAKKGDVVMLSVPESAKPILVHLQNAVLKAGAHPMIHFIPEGLSRSYFENASIEQLKWQPEPYLLERIKTVTHFVSIISTNDKFELKGVDSSKIMTAQKSLKFYMDAKNKKENSGALTWTLGLFGTEAMAKEANMSLREYWEQIIKGCYLDFDDPVAKWQEVFKNIKKTQDYLNSLKIDSLKITGDDVDLTIKIGKNRKWLGGSGRNIPSFELFITPDWRGTEGSIKFNQPLYRYGNLIEGISLEFKNGIVTKFDAKKNKKLLGDMLAVEGANKIGEFSLTDKRLSRITKFMAETLFDENIGGDFGNMHIAVGSGYKDSYDGDPAKITSEQWIDMGFNDSAIHTDIITTTNRKVEATLASGETIFIYKDGGFANSKQQTANSKQ